VIEGRPNTIHIHTDYNIAIKYKMMPESILAEVTSDRDNRPTLYKHKWLGLPSAIERKIYNDWATIETVPHEAKLVRRGMDFGYKNDETAIISIYQYNGGYIVDEELYRKGMLNDQIASFLNNLNEPNTLVVADSSEPKSIEEIRRYGVNIVGVKKAGGDDSLGNKKSFKKYAIDFVQQQRISVTKRSENAWREYCGYLYKEDKDGRILNDPEDGNDHAMDATLYGFHSLRPQTETTGSLAIY
jgi:phage terminase large subunit